MSFNCIQPGASPGIERSRKHPAKRSIVSFIRMKNSSGNYMQVAGMPELGDPVILMDQAYSACGLAMSVLVHPASVVFVLLPCRSALRRGHNGCLAPWLWAIDFQFL